jgi:hypothetical protein
VLKYLILLQYYYVDGEKDSSAFLSLAGDFLTFVVEFWRRWSPRGHVPAVNAEIHRIIKISVSEVWNVGGV